EVTEKKVRRERMGHIKLVVPIVHIWFFKSLPNKIGNLLGLSSKKLESITYYERFAVIQPGVCEVKLSKLDLLSEEEYLDIMDILHPLNQILLDAYQYTIIEKMRAEAVNMML